MKTTTTISITFEDGKEVHFTKEEAAKLYEYLKEMFGTKKVSILVIPYPNYPIITCNPNSVTYSN